MDTRPDTITLTGIRAWGHHGVLPHERELGQVFVVDVVMEVDLGPAGASDDLADTVDYGAMAQQVHDVVAGQTVQLLEALAARVASTVLADDRVTSTTITIHKPSAPFPVPTAEASVTITRSR